jgi:hypothetical protein
MIAAACRPLPDGAPHRIRLTGSSAIFSDFHRRDIFLPYFLSLFYGLQRWLQPGEEKVIDFRELD